MTLELQNIEKNVEGSQHIYPTSLVLEKNTINILLGATLSGKTTLMQLMGGIEKPTEGKILFNGNDVTKVSVQKRNISMVYQQFINYPNFTVYENIASPLRLQKMEESVIDQKVQEIADLLKLTPMLSRKPNELSGGQQQRTALARALVKDSDLILLDEPFANLDFKLREELREELPKMFENKNTIVVYATTEPSEALLLGGNTVLLEEGKVIQFGKTQEIYRRPFNIKSANVFSDPPLNRTQISVKNNIATLDSVSWNVSLQDGEYTLGIRPHHVYPKKNNEKFFEITGQVSIAEISGSETLVHFKLKDNEWVSQSHGVHNFNLGETTKFYIDTSKCLYFDNQGAFING